MRIGRRAFLGGAGAFVAGCAGGLRSRAPGASGVVGPIGLDLSTLREPMERDFDGTLARVAAIGYRDVELAGMPPRPLVEIKAALGRAGLTARSLQASPGRLRQSMKETLDRAKQLDVAWVVCAGIADDSGERGIDEYRRAVEWMNGVGEEAHARGLGFAYKNDERDLVGENGQIRYDALFETDPSLVKMEMDVAWLVRAGADPSAYFDRHPGRFPLLHLKDLERSAEQKTTSVGAGSIDFRRILARRDDAGVELVFVEDDDAAYPFASIEASFKYLSSLR